MYSLDRNLLISDPLIFRRLIRTGKRIREKRISLFWSPAEPRELKAGFTTTRKMKNAVARNRARRLMREVFRLHRFDLRKGIRLVLRWSGEVNDCGYADAEEEIMRLWRRAGLLKK